MNNSRIEKEVFNQVPNGETHESIKRLLPFQYNSEIKYVLDGGGKVRLQRHNINSFSSTVCGRRDLKTMYERMNR